MRFAKEDSHSGFISSESDDSSSCSREEREDDGCSYDLYLPERSVLVLCSDARYKWTHGIENRRSDFVLCDDTLGKGRRVERGVRLSITFRWLLPGADVVGGDG